MRPGQASLPNAYFEGVVERERREQRLAIATRVACALIGASRAVDVGFAFNIADQLIKGAGSEVAPPAPART